MGHAPLHSSVRPQTSRENAPMAEGRASLLHKECLTRLKHAEGVCLWCWQPAHMSWLCGCRAVRLHGVRDQPPPLTVCTAPWQTRQ